MMSILNNIEKTFNEKGIHYFIGSDKENRILNVPYRGIENKENHINIYIDVNEQFELITFTFLAKANKNVDIKIIREKLLDLNFELSFGTLSMRSDSNTIEYKFDLSVSSGIFSFDKYNASIVRCINVYERMQKEDII